MVLAMAGLVPHYGQGFLDMECHCWNRSTPGMFRDKMVHKSILRIHGNLHPPSIS